MPPPPSSTSGSGSGPEATAITTTGTSRPTSSQSDDTTTPSTESYQLRSRSRPRRPSTSSQHSQHSTSSALLSTARAAEARVEEALRVLLHWDDLPAWRRDNAFIVSGYRPTSYSVSGSFGSLLYMHNETVNIWTHLLGAVFFLAVGGWFLWKVIAPRVGEASGSDVLVFSCFFGGAMACLGMSATFHTLCNHSPEVAMWGNKLDYTGIVFLIVGSYVPALYYGWFCHEVWLTGYLAAVSFSPFPASSHCLKEYVC